MSIMPNHRLVCASLLIASVIMPAAAHADVDVEVTTAPPTLQSETIPEARTGYVWSPGYWAWNKNISKYEWVKGHWVEARVGELWVPDKWTQDPANPNVWHFKAGHWEP